MKLIVNLYLLITHNVFFLIKMEKIKFILFIEFIALFVVVSFNLVTFFSKKEFPISIYWIIPTIVFWICLFVIFIIEPIWDLFIS